MGILEPTMDVGQVVRLYPPKISIPRKVMNLQQGHEISFSYHHLIYYSQKARNIPSPLQIHRKKWCMKPCPLARKVNSCLFSHHIHHHSPNHMSQCQDSHLDSQTPFVRIMRISISLVYSPYLTASRANQKHLYHTRAVKIPKRNEL
jgi:hypothetical protein